MYNVESFLKQMCRFNKFGCRKCTGADVGRTVAGGSVG